MSTAGLIVGICVFVGLLVVLSRNLQPRSSGQLGAVRRARYSARPFMNKSELQLFHYVNSWLTHNAQGYYISAQAAYGSFLGSKDSNAWRYVSAKRADFVVFDRNGTVHLIIEFDGGGHYGNSRKGAAGVKDRDEQKNAAAASAGIPLLRITDLKNRHAIADALARIIKPAIGRHASKSTNSKEAASQ